MAKRKYQFDRNGKAQVPWHEEYTLDHFDSPGDFEEHLDYMADQWEQLGARLRPGQPHPLAYPDQWDDEGYKTDLRIWESVEAQEQVMARHAPRPDPSAIPVDLRALHHGNREDQIEVKRRMEAHQFIQDQLNRAAEHEALGHIAQARVLLDCPNRC